MDKSDGTAKVWRKKDLLMIPNIQAHLKHSGGNVMAWAFIASSGTGSLIFINDVTHDGSSKINSEVYRNILSDNLQKDATKLIGRSFIIQQDNDPKQQRSSSGQEVEGFRLAKSISTLNPIEPFCIFVVCDWYRVAIWRFHVKLVNKILLWWSVMARALNGSQLIRDIPPFGMWFAD